MRKSGTVTQQLGELRAQDTLAFVNEPLSERRWEGERGRKFHNVLLFELLHMFELVHPEVATGRRYKPASSARLVRVQAIQRELRATLEEVVLGRDLESVIQAINREGPFGYTLIPDFGSTRRNTAAIVDLYWKPDERGTDRHRAMRALADTLVAVGSTRIGQCDYTACRRFFLLKRNRAQRFCSERCSTLYWKETRLESGYFTKKRRENRARKRAKG